MTDWKEAPAENRFSFCLNPRNTIKKSTVLKIFIFFPDGLNINSFLAENKQ